MRSLIKMGFAMGLLGFLLNGCGRKDHTPKNLAEWLELRAPGKYMVLESHISDPIGNVSLKVRRSVVAEISDPMVQTVISWDKRQPGLGVTEGHIDSAFVKASEGVADIRQLQSLLAKHNCTQCVVGIDRGSAKIILLNQPLDEYRRKSMEQIAAATAEWSKAGEYALDVLCFEMPLTEYTDFYPLAVWAQPGQEIDRHITYFRRYDRAGDCVADDSEWEYNTNSNAFYRLLDSTRLVMQEWIVNGRHDGIYLTNQTESLKVNGRNAMYEISIPFSSQNRADDDPGDTIAVDGYIVCNLNIGNGKCTDIRITRESPE